jgi:hypothetical protein
MLDYSYIDPEEPIGIPPRLPNGGLYTGQTPPKGAGWGNIPIEPEAHKMVMALSSTVPNAITAIPGYTRPGNNTQTFPGHQPVTSYQFMCRK